MKTHRMFLTAIARPQSLAASLVLLALLLAMAASHAPLVHAATITVNSTEDSEVSGDEKCTLREAIYNAEHDNGDYSDCTPGSGDDVINFTVAGTIWLGSALPQISHTVTITGPGQSSLTLDGQSAHRVFQIYCSAGSCSINISDLTIQHASDIEGSAIWAGRANMTLSHVTIKNNTVSPTGGGAPMFCGADGSKMTTLNNVTFSYNSGANAGALISSDCLLFLNSVLFDHNTSSNRAGAMNMSGAATLSNVGFNNNTTAGSGGALFSDGVITVTNSSFINNKATGTGAYGGAIYFSAGGLKGSIDTSTFTGNSADYGAGITMMETAASLTVTNTTFSNNIAKTSGGGIWSDGILTGTNITFNGNQVTDPAAGYGGAVDNEDNGQMTLANATFDGNIAISGSAIYNDSGGSMMLVNNTIATNFTGPAISGYSGITLTNTIVSDHTEGNCALESGEVIADGGGNLNFASHGHDCPGISANPMLYWLGYNGGYVSTRPFMEGSGAINAGNPTTCAAAVGSPTFGAGGADARGLPRRSGFCDIGAFEAQPASVSATTGSSPQSAIITTAFAHALGVKVTDAYTNTLGGVTVTYSGPAGGAGAVLSATAATSDASGNASVTATANALAGSYSVTANATGTTPVTFNLTNTPGTTTTNITSHLPHPSHPGQAITVLYTVTSPHGTPTGNVTVSAGTTNCTGTVAAGSCSLTFTTVETKTLTAVYAGDGNFGGSTSISHAHTVLNWQNNLPLMIRP